MGILLAMLLKATRGFLHSLYRQWEKNLLFWRVFSVVLDSMRLCKFMRQANVKSAMPKDRISLVLLFNTVSKYEPLSEYLKLHNQSIGKHSAEHYYSIFEFIFVSPLWPYKVLLVSKFFPTAGGSDRFRFSLCLFVFSLAFGTVNPRRPR